MYKCKYFTLEELIPKALYEELEAKNRLHVGWMLLDSRLLQTLDDLRYHLGPITVNDWAVGGTNQFRGFRPADCTIGATYSQHRFGRAADCIFKNHTAEEVREYVKKTSQQISIH